MSIEKSGNQVLLQRKPNPPSQARDWVEKERKCGLVATGTLFLKKVCPSLKSHFQEGSALGSISERDPRELTAFNLLRLVL